MGTIASQITSLTSVYSTVYSGADQSKHQSSASLAFVWGIHRGPVNSPHKWPVTRKMFPFDDVIMAKSPNIASHRHGIKKWCPISPWELTAPIALWFKQLVKQFQNSHLPPSCFSLISYDARVRNISMSSYVCLGKISKYFETYFLNLYKLDYDRHNEIIYPVPKFNGYIFEVWEWSSNFFANFIRNVFRHT